MLVANAIVACWVVLGVLHSFLLYSFQGKCSHFAYFSAVALRCWTVMMTTARRALGCETSSYQTFFFNWSVCVCVDPLNFYLNQTVLTTSFHIALHAVLLVSWGEPACICRREKYFQQTLYRRMKQMLCSVPRKSCRYQSNSKWRCVERSFRRAEKQKNAPELSTLRVCVCMFPSCLLLKRRTSPFSHRLFRLFCCCNYAMYDSVQDRRSL